MLKNKIMETALSADKKLVYRAVEHSGCLGIEIEYLKNSLKRRKTVTDLTKEPAEILNMNRLFADGTVYPEVFEETAADYAKSYNMNYRSISFQHLEIMEEYALFGNMFIYRSVRTDNEKYGVEFEYREYGNTYRITAAELSENKNAIIKMNRLFAEGIVFPQVFEETAEDYLKSIGCLHISNN